MAVAVDVLFLSGVLFGVSREFAAAVYPYLTRCLLGFALFALVMYIGALPEGSKARQMLMPIRGELSIIAAILTVGHVANYLGTYLADILSGFAGMSAGMVASFVVSSLLIVLLALQAAKVFELGRKLMATLAGLLATCIAVDAFFIGCELLTVAYPQTAGGTETLGTLFNGVTSPFFWFEIIAGLLIPFCILVFAKNRARMGWWPPPACAWWWACSSSACGCCSPRSSSST